MIYPKTLSELINYFKKFSGVGEKSAERLALSLLDFSQEELDDFSNLISKSKRMLHPCQKCKNITDEESCYICSNETRNQDVICVVEDYRSIFVFEKTGNYNGIYHVLEGLISPIDGIGPEDINISSLISRCQSNKNISEIIIALKPSIEGETTTQYIKKILEKNHVKISRLSYGIPIGADFDYLDSLTVERAFYDRKEIE